jgi:hypothetical protein
MDAYTARIKELKAQLRSELKAFSDNPSAHNYRQLENTMFLFQYLIKNTTPAEYNTFATHYDPTSTLESA